MRKISKVGFIGLGINGHADDGPPAWSEPATKRCVTGCGLKRVRKISATASVNHELTKETLGYCDVLITMLPNFDIVEEVLLYNGLATRALPLDAVVIDMSSSVPMRSRQLAGKVAVMGLHWLDAPAFRGVKRAAESQLAIMVGSELQDWHIAPR